MATTQVYMSKARAQRARRRAQDAAAEAVTDFHTATTREARQAADARLERVTRMLDSIDATLAEME